MPARPPTISGYGISNSRLADRLRLVDGCCDTDSSDAAEDVGTAAVVLVVAVACIWFGSVPPSSKL